MKKKSLTIREVEESIVKTNNLENHFIASCIKGIVNYSRDISFFFNDLFSTDIVLIRVNLTKSKLSTQTVLMVSTWVRMFYSCLAFVF